MFYFMFKKIYYKIRDEINAGNKKRLDREVLDKNITVNTYQYKDNLAFNIYSKDNSSNTLVIDIHGGGWICGDKDTNRGFCYELAKANFKVCSLDYRLIDKVTIKEQIEDIFCLFKYLETNKDIFNLKLDNVILTGDSAGGQLALLSYIINERTDLREIFNVDKINFNIKGLILNHSVCNLDLAAKLRGHRLLSKYVSIPGLLRMLYGKGYKNKEIYQKTADPKKYIYKETKLPKILIISSLGDKEYKYQSDILVSLLNEKGKDCFYYLEQSDAEHVFNIARPNSEEGIKCNLEIINFINGLI